MTNGSSQGLFVVVAVVIFGIFVAISYLLFRDQLTPSLASIFGDSLSFSIRSQYSSIATLKDFNSSNPDVATIKSKKDSELIYSHDGSSVTYNIYIKPIFFKPERQYSLEYEIELLDGIVETLGGHNASFEGGQILATPQNFYIDGELKGNYYSGVAFTLNKGEKHKIKVLLDTRNETEDSLKKSMGVYIQPNRSYTSIIKNTEYNGKQSPAYTVKISNLIVYEI